MLRGRLLAVAGSLLLGAAALTPAEQGNSRVAPPPQLEMANSPTLPAAFVEGFDYLLAAQYPNGGWPQYFPLCADYSRHITFNDDAMVHVMEVLRDAAAGKAPYVFVDSRGGRGRPTRSRGA